MIKKNAGTSSAPESRGEESRGEEPHVRVRGEVDFERLVGLPAKKPNVADGMTIDGVCAGGFKANTGDMFLKFSWDNVEELDTVNFEVGAGFLKDADKRNLLEKVLTSFRSFDISTPQGKEKLRRVEPDAGNGDDRMGQ